MEGLNWYCPGWHMWHAGEAHKVDRKAHLPLQIILHGLSSHISALLSLAGLMKVAQLLRGHTSVAIKKVPPATPVAQSSCKKRLMGVT